MMGGGQTKLGSSRQLRRRSLLFGGVECFLDGRLEDGGPEQGLHCRKAGGHHNFRLM